MASEELLQNFLGFPDSNSTVKDNPGSSPGLISFYNVGLLITGVCQDLFCFVAINSLEIWLAISNYLDSRKVR